MKSQARKSEPDVTSDINNRVENISEIIVNPLSYRSEIFTAVRLSHREETLGRYVHYDTRRDNSILPVESKRPYSDSNEKLDINVMISKTGQRYRLEGTITDKKSFKSFTTICFLKTIPARYSLSNPALENQPYQVPTLSEIRERLIGLQLQLNEIQREQTALMRSSFNQSDSTPAYHQDYRYQESNFTPYSPQPTPYQQQNNSINY